MSRIGNKDAPANRPLTPTGPQKLGEGAGQSHGSAGVDKQGPAKNMTSADAERISSQAGFVRTGVKKKGQGFDVGDSSQAPIPLPEDDVDAEAWSSEVLADAQRRLLLHNARLGRGRSKQAGQTLKQMFAAVAEGGGDEGGDGEDDEAARMARLQGLAEQTPPSSAAMAALAQSVRTQFAVDLDGTPPGAALLATSLLVAGHKDEVQAAGKAAGGGLVADKLMGGLQRVVDEGRGAAEDARKRSEGVSRSLAMHRTFVPKR